MTGDIMGEESVIAHFVTEIHAEAVLAELLPWLRDRPPIDQFREQLDATVEIIWAIHRAAAHYRIVNEAFRQFRESAKLVKTARQAMEENAFAPEMANFAGLPKLDEVRSAFAAVDRLERDLSRIPAAFSGQQKPAKGPAPRNWYSRFVRDLAEIVKELGIEVTTQGGRSHDRGATPFTRFVFAVEKLLPPGNQSNSLEACAKQIERAIKASAQEIGIERAFVAHVRKGKRAFRAYARLIGKDIRRKVTP